MPSSSTKSPSPQSSAAKAQSAQTQSAQTQAAQAQAVTKPTAVPDMTQVRSMLTKAFTAHLAQFEAAKSLRERGQLFQVLWSLLRMRGQNAAYFSEAGQDRHLDATVFQGKRAGTFVEIGAYDGVSGSNCLFFESFRDWRGLVVEASPEQARAVVPMRRSGCLQVAVGAREGTAEFYQVTDGYTQMSGLSEGFDDNRLAVIRSHPKHAETTLTVPMRRLDGLLREHNLWHVDYCSLDVEGGEQAILSSFPFEEFTVDVWTIENNTDDPAQRRLMERHGYVLVAQIGQDEVFLREAAFPAAVIAAASHLDPLFRERTRSDAAKASVLPDGPTAKALLTRAVSCFKAGDLDAAYKALNQHDGRALSDAGGLNLLGAILVRRGDAGGALEAFSKAVALDPSYVDGHSNRGAVLQGMNRRPEALEAFDTALTLSPNHPDASLNRIKLLQAMSRHGDALEAVARLEPHRPSDPELQFVKAISLRGEGEREVALEAVEASVAARPNHAEAQALRAALLDDLGRPEEALIACEASLALSQAKADVHYNHGGILRKLKRYDDALAAYDRALAIQPNGAHMHSNRGTVLQVMQRYEEALASYDRALELKPDYPEALVNRAGVLSRNCRFEEAIESCSRALDVRPDFHMAAYQRSLTQLMLGDFETGFVGYEHRFDIPEAPRRPNFPIPYWDGEDIADKHLVVFAEQGLGDMLQFVRYLPLLKGKAKAKELTFIMPKKMSAILRDATKGYHLIFTRTPRKTFDLQVALMSLPRIFETRVEAIPAPVPYISVSSVQTRKWKKRIGEEGFKVGLCWQGSPHTTIDHGRSIPLKAFAPLGGLADVRLISLQKHHGMEQVNDLPEGMTVEMPEAPFDEGPDAFVDAAAVMKALDLVVTSDTAIAHLAGALGCPVWLALKHVPHWVWLLDREDCPWYPSMRLFRQQSDGDWDGVFARMAEALETEKEQRPRSKGWW